VEAAEMLLSGQSPWKFPALQAFNNWPDVQDYSKTDEGAELRSMVRLIDNYGVETIVGMMANCIDGADKKQRNKPADVTVITAHKAKGLEWNRVLIHSDFKPAKSETGPSDVDLKLCYVAVTRAKLYLDASALAWVFDPTLLAV
jgi:ATP-dependent exoDNAse (exonuclease V) beta subunit